MERLRGWSKQLRALLRKQEVEGELDEELAFHLEMETAKNIREGMPPEEARRAAMLAFGGVERWKEEVRDARWIRVLEDLAADGRYALRALRRAPAFTLTVVLTLALGIGANTTIFSAVDALLLRALPFPHRDRLVEVRHLRQSGEEWEQTSAANFLALREGSPGLEGLAAYAGWSAYLTRAAHRERLVAFRATPDFFSLLGARPLIGRTFAPDEGAPGRNRVAVIGERLWKRRFGGDPAVLGTALTLDGDAYTVVGVMPARVAFPAEADLWAPASFDAAWPQSVSVVGRVRAGVAVAQVQDEASALLRRLVRDEPRLHTGAGVVLRRLYWEQTEYLHTFLTLLATAVAFVLLVACANVANLLLARASTRGRELAIRAALGASRGRLFRQLLVESLLLSLLGGALGVALAVAAVWGLRGSVPADLSRFMSGWDAIAVDARVLGFTLAVTVAAGVLFGVAPALGGSRPSVALPGGERGAGTARGGRLRRVLVA
ncbi:MAG: ABC transporter permease, partial [Gemmatimonadetes bacterium]|nr:ABC transporter permease [Gemmatimonadota bacterium]